MPFAAVFLLPVALFAQTPRDYWLKTELKGQGYAFEHMTVTTLPGASRHNPRENPGRTTRCDRENAA